MRQPPPSSSLASRLRPPAAAAATFATRRALLSYSLAASLLLAPLPAPAIDLSTTITALQQQEKTVENLFDAVTPSVVQITSFVERTDRFSMNAVEVPAGTGSGFVWDNDGHVVTNVRSAGSNDERKKMQTPEPASAHCWRLARARVPPAVSCY